MDGPRAKPWWMELAETRIRGPRALSRTAERLKRLFGGPWPDLVGVDVSEASVKLVRVRRRAGGISGVVSAERAIPSGAGSPAERRARAAAALRELVVNAGARGARASCCLTGTDIVVRRITMPEMKKSDVLPALQLEFRKHVNIPIEETSIRYEVVGTGEKHGARTMDLVVTAAPRRKIEEAMQLLQDGGLRPVCVTIRPAALQALLEEAGDIARDEVVAYLDMGAAETHVTVLRGEEIRFAREFGVGGATLTDALRSIVVPGRGNVNLTSEEAETLKRTHGIPFGAEEARSAGPIPLSAVSVMLRPILEKLARELWNSFDYVNEQFQGESVARVALLGEGSRIRNLPEYLTGVLKIPVSRADASERMLPDRARAVAGSPVSELGLGLALIGRRRLNFAAPVRSGAGYQVAQAVPQRIAAAAAIVLLVSVCLPAEMTVMRERQRVGSLRATLEEFRPRAEALRRFRAAREEEMRIQDLLAELSGGQVLWSYVLRDLSHRVAANVRLTTLEVVEPKAPAGAAPAAEGRLLRLGGLLDTDRERPETVLAALMHSLGRSPVIDQVRLEGCQTVTSSMSSFTLTARIAD